RILFAGSPEGAHLAQQWGRAAKVTHLLTQPCRVLRVGRVTRPVVQRILARALAILVERLRLLLVGQAIGAARLLAQPAAVRLRLLEGNARGRVIFLSSLHFIALVETGILGRRHLE